MPLTINIPERELFDNKTQEFFYTNPETIVLEHSLISISKWEAKWHVSYFLKEKKTIEQVYSYIQCMCIKGNSSMEVLCNLTDENLLEIMDYIDNPMTATTVREDDKPKKEDNFLTSEVIYSFMVGYSIPIECEKWHINRLLTLIKVLNEQNKEPKKKSEAELIRDYKKINERNKALFHTTG